jgi:transcriptional regulator with XRE-family HTH domain
VSDRPVLVTGAAGFIGSNLVARLLEDGRRVVGVDDLSTGSLANLAPARARHAGRFEFDRLDVRQGGLGPLIQRLRPEVVFHLAAQVDVRRSVEDPMHDASVNVLGTIAVLEAARQGGVRKVVYAGSIGSYGEPAVASLPIDESFDDPALSPYGASKRVAIDYLRTYGQLHGLEWTTLTFANVYGPHRPPQVRAASWPPSPDGCWPANPSRSTATVSRPATSCSSTTSSRAGPRRRPGVGGTSAHRDRGAHLRHPAVPCAGGRDGLQPRAGVRASPRRRDPAQQRRQPPRGSRARLEAVDEPRGGARCHPAVGGRYRAARASGEVGVSYTRDVGERLRRIRVERGLSLQDVERSSGGRWKAAVVGSYERGDRNISATRLLELAEFYDVAPGDILPGEAAARRMDNGGALVLDLERLATLGDRWAGVRRYCESIQLQRGDFNRRVLSVRGDDVRALAVIHETTPEALVTELRELGVLQER